MKREGLKRYVVRYSMGLATCSDTNDFDVDDDATEEEIEQAAREAMLDRMEWWYWLFFGLLL